MLHPLALSAVAHSIADVVRARVEASRKAVGESVGVRVLGSAEMRGAGAEPTLGIFVHRVEPQAHLVRPAALRAAAPTVAAPPLELHFLLVAIASTGDEELALIELGMQALADEPVLTEQRLRPHARDWPAGQAVSISSEPLSNDDVARIWTALAAPSWLAAAYSAR